jgi:hypothetical protein
MVCNLKDHDDDDLCDISQIVPDNWWIQYRLYYFNI